MSVKQAYDQWSAQYDTNKNRTRDLEGDALRTVLAGLTFQRVLEIGCGTGKNTVWLAERAKEVTAVDLSDGMLAIARSKVTAPHVSFVHSDILQPWSFAASPVDLLTFSLVLEHIEDLAPIMQKAAAVLTPGGQVYIGELHPFKQYQGTKARFGTENGTETVTCFDHHVSDFTEAARQAGLQVETLREFFDADDAQAPPRILSLLLRKR